MKIFKCEKNIYVHCGSCFMDVNICMSKLMKLHALDMQFIVHYLYFKVVKKMVTVKMIENAL